MIYQLITPIKVAMPLPVPKVRTNESKVCGAYRNVSSKKPRAISRAKLLLILHGAASPHIDYTYILHWYFRGICNPGGRRRKVIENEPETSCTAFLATIIGEARTGSTRPAYSHEFHVPSVMSLLAPFRPKIAGSGGTRAGECKCYGDFNSTEL